MNEAQLTNERFRVSLSLILLDYVSLYCLGRFRITSSRKNTANANTFSGNAMGIAAFNPSMFVEMLTTIKECGNPTSQTNGQNKRMFMASQSSTALLQQYISIDNLVKHSRRNHRHLIINRTEQNINTKPSAAFNEHCPSVTTNLLTKHLHIFPLWSV